MDIKRTSGCNISKFDNNGKLDGWRTVGNWIYIEERQGKNPKDRVLGEGRHEIEVKNGHIWKKDKEKIQKTGCTEKKIMKWNRKLDIK